MGGLHQFESDEFESAVDAVVTGNIATLESLLREDPELVRARSARAHRATLLHYVAANGVEDERQKSPGNAVLIAETLLKSGAEVDACAGTYGGGATQTTLNLLVSSVHPARAGVQVALVRTLLNFGAAINGIEDDGSPLLTALAFHYPEAAEALVRRGARIETVIAAAALGREDLVERFLSTDAANSDLQVALVWAAMHRRLAVVELLLRKGVDSGSRDRRGWTALHWAAHYGYPEIVDLLLKFDPPLEIENEFGGTPLNQTVWTTIHERLLPDHLVILDRLIEAGAKVEPGWFDASLRPPLDPRVATVLRPGY
jgi:ankyrin repeat protein